MNAATDSTRSESYIGRFAPSPTGPLHFGSLVAALGSWLDARAAGGRWLVRMEDLDRPRCVPGAGDTILRQLEHYGLVWDGAVLAQSNRDAAYESALQQLRDLGAVYRCVCTRRQLSDATRNAQGETIYPGTCRDGIADAHTPCMEGVCVSRAGAAGTGVNRFVLRVAWRINELAAGADARIHCAQFL